MSSRLFFRGLLILIICAIQGIESQNGRFCSDIAWTKACSSVSDSGISRRKRDADSDLNKELSEEANKNSPFALAWKKAENDVKLPNLMEKYTVLKRSEIKLIMAYTYSIKPYFYESLNEDCRDNGLNGGQYPNTKRILRDALIKLGDSQKLKSPLPEMLYRKQNASLLDGFISMKNQNNTDKLLQFTSTSRSRNAFNCRPDQDVMLVIFKNPQSGADIAEFSGYSEEEVLLPLLNGTFYVESVDESQKEAVVVGPTYSANSKPCTSGSGQTGVHFIYVLFAICLVITVQKQINL